MLRTPSAVRDAERHTAHNYHPLPVVISSAEGAWLTDVDGRRYLDCLAGYSALNFGHRHPKLIEAAHTQLDRLTLTSRAFIHDQFADFCRELAALCGKDLVLPMNTGAEAVETGIKVARKWGYQVKGVTPGQANIVVAEGNFHGRTTTIVSFSTDEDARASSAPRSRTGSPGSSTQACSTASAASACGRASTSTRRAGRAATCARRCSRAASSPRTRTARPSASLPRSPSRPRTSRPGCPPWRTP